MRTLKTRLTLSTAAILALTAAPAAAAGVEEAVVPPSNSAAAQYTETFPTSSGDKKTDKNPNQRSPSKVLGSKNTRKLQQHGPAGQAAAEAAAATAPTAVAPVTTSPPSQGGGGSTDGTSSSGSTKGEAKTDISAGHAVKSASAANPPAGSSGIGLAIEQATGLSTSGQSGMLLPLVILATVLCSVAYLWRQRRQVG